MCFRTVIYIKLSEKHIEVAFLLVIFLYVTLFCLLYYIILASLLKEIQHAPSPTKIK